MSHEIQLDPGSLAQIVQKAVLDSITPEAREKLLTEAITFILTVPKDDRPEYQRRYGDAPKSPLQTAFTLAVNQAASIAVREAIAEDPKVAEAIRQVVHPLVADLCEGNYQGLPEAIGAAFATWLSERRS